MKAITANVNTGASAPRIPNNGGRVNRPRDRENAEIQMYLSKLKDLVPFMPKNRKLSKLEVIQNVIDYICDLQNALESHPNVNNFDPIAALAAGQQSTMDYLDNETMQMAPRQPLVIKNSPNQIVANTSSSNSTSDLSSLPASSVHNVRIYTHIFTLASK